ncbi:DNA methyltransferase [Sphingomonas sp.]|uniref:DNA methyltransferase n=1 Tax=Sphingomonas sp. TaxID=28214 RepID=UPI002EDB9BCB
MSQLYYGDNLEVLREHVADESVDLIYLDPPFNSNANYNILFKSPKGAAADSQIEAFEDTWHYGPEAAQAFHEVMTSGNTDVANLLRSMQEFLGQNDMMAYLAMMAARLIHLHRVLKPTGSLYLHCDPTASHYLKLLLDGVFGASNFRNEIVWERTNSHNMKTAGWTRSNDTIFFYSKSESWVFNTRYQPYGPEQMKRYRPDADGRLYKAENLTFSSANKSRQFEWRGTRPPPNRSWGASLEQLEKWWAEGRILKRQDGSPRMDGLKVYLDEMPGKPVGTNWADIDRVGNTSGERLGYPTQKPLALLERIISASSNEGDVVLDPFCGCGTAVHAAQKLGRQWIGIDVTYLAIGLIERRLREAFPRTRFEVVGEPKGLMDAEHLAASEPYQFQYWITQKIGGQPYRGGRKGADRGIDGYIYYTKNDAAAGKSSTAAAIISVKAGRNVGVAMIRELKGVLEREKADIGIFVCVANPSREMEREAAAAEIWTDPVTGIGYPRLQIFTLAELFQNRQPSVPLLDRQAGYKRAKAEENSEQGLLL